MVSSRKKVYEDALIRFGSHNQLVVAIEELSELQKEICKFFRHEGTVENLVEEVADVSIMIEQIKFILDIEDDVNKVMGEKIERLKRRIEKL